MKRSLLFIGGCAGSSVPAAARITCPSVHSNIPLARPVRRMEFGTHTTSFGIVSGEVGAFIDHGTGVGQVSRFLLAERVKEVYGFQTHFHHDHRLGIHTNRLLFNKEGLVRSISAPRLGGKSFEELVEKDFSRETWPVSPEMFGIKHNFLEFDPGEALPMFGGVRTFPLKHPGGCVGYRFTLPEGDVVIATDVELDDEESISHFAVHVEMAKILYVDMQYRDEEYSNTKGVDGNTSAVRKGYGHSTPSMLLAALKRCAVPPGLILIGHHDPERSDEDLKRFESEVQETLKELGSKVRFARECDVIEM